ncbi:MAG: hypothetical protein DRJ38_07015 [Thermoprotei archaeon]|mgnify:CR=1 FL=1|nr:MAG: hypothetical protein DRJ38_07015 [Thermoprotei archaeon]
MKIAVTGSAGFLGRHIVRKLRSLNYRVVEIDKRQGVDIRNYKEILEILKRESVEAVIHCAALVSVEESVYKPIEYVDNNVLGTVSLLKSAVDAGVKKVVYISSAAVYGNPKYLPIDEKHPLEPISPYGATKLAGEFLVKAFYETYRLKYVILRPFNIYGPGQNPAYAGVISKFIERVSRGLPPIIYGDGQQTRDFVYVEDVAEAIAKAVEKRLEKEVFNIATGKPTKIVDLAKLVMKLFKNEDLKPIFENPRPGDIRHSYASITKAVEKLGWKPSTGLEEGLKKTIEWFTG